MKKVIGFIIMIIVVVLLFKMLNGVTKNVAESNMTEIQNRVAADAENQYGIAKRQGDKMQIYVQAGMVSAAYLQAGDETNYRKWKEIEKKDGKAVGITE